MRARCSISGTVRRSHSRQPNVSFSSGGESSERKSKSKVVEETKQKRDSTLLQEAIELKSSGFSHLFVMVAIVYAANLSILRGSSEAESARFCSGALVQNLGTAQCGTALKICIDGVLYKSPGMEKDRLIRWQDVSAWKYFGPRRAAENAASQEYVSLQIWESRGKKHRFNIGCGTTADGQIVFQSMKRYQPSGMLF
jgi:hypothetical protein